MFVQGRISRPIIIINGSKLLFHLRMYIYEIYKSHDRLTYILRLLTAKFGRFSMVKIFVIGRFLSSTDGSKLILYQRRDQQRLLS